MLKEVDKEAVTAPCPAQYEYKVFAFDIYFAEALQILAWSPTGGIVEHLSTSITELVIKTKILNQLWETNRLIGLTCFTKQSDCLSISQVRLMSAIAIAQ